MLSPDWVEAGASYVCPSCGGTRGAPVDRLSEIDDGVVALVVIVGGFSVYTRCCRADFEFGRVAGDCAVTVLLPPKHLGHPKSRATLRFLGISQCLTGS